MNDKTLRRGAKLRERLRVIDVVLIILCLALFGSIIIKIKNRGSPLKGWEKILDVPIASRDRSGMILSNELASDGNTYILLMELSNCPSCIYKGISEIRDYRKRGEKGIILVSHQWIEEWLSWAINYEQESIYFVKKEDLESVVMFSYLPIILRTKDGKISSYKYITY